MGSEHLQKLARLIQLEADAEKRLVAQRLEASSDAATEAAGDSLLDLAIEDEQPGLGQRYLVTLVKRNRSLELPWTRLRGGSPVLLTDHDHGDWVRAVVVRRDRRSIQIAVDELPTGDRFRIHLAADEITRRRQLEAMDLAAKTERGPLARLRDVLLGERSPSFREVPTLEFFAELSDSQREAVQFAMSAQDVAIVHGPPGTGKTTTVVEIIRQSVAAGESVLACGPSNHAADHLAWKLNQSGLNVVRVGHPARVQASLQNRTLDALVANHERVKIARKCQREAMQLLSKANRYTRSKPEPGEKRAWRQAARDLLAEARGYERKAVQEVLDDADVVCGTTTVDPSLLGDRLFDLLVIDEGCQSTEPGCWVPLQFGERLILAGDHCQLPPTVLSHEAARDGLSVSLQERIVERYGETLFRRLTTQYRMHRQIMQFSSTHFYDDQLECFDEVAEHCLADLEGVAANETTECAVEFFDTAGADFDELLEPEGSSRLNPREARFVAMKVQQLIEHGLTPDAIGVITPYSAQVRQLQSIISIEGVEVDSVDGFQGREKEAIVFSAVRSNRQGEVGFLKDVRRTNVALTRARRKLIFVGDSATLGAHEFYGQLIDYFQSIGAHRSVWEEPFD